MEQNHLTNMFLSFELRYVCIFKYDVNPILEFSFHAKTWIEPRSIHWIVFCYWYPVHFSCIYFFMRSRLYWAKQNIGTIKIRWFFSLNNEHFYISRREWFSIFLTLRTWGLVDYLITRIYNISNLFIYVRYKCQCYHV